MTRLKPSDLLTIGEIARRTGLSVSAIRFYEDKRLIEPVRTGGNQRRFLRSDIRRLSFILIAQRLGLSLGEIEAELGKLPQGRTPSEMSLYHSKACMPTKVAPSAEVATSSQKVVLRSRR